MVCRYRGIFAVDRRLRIRNLEEEGEALNAGVDRSESDTCEYFERLEDNGSSDPPTDKITDICTLLRLIIF